MRSVVFVFICMGELCAMKIGGSRGESGSAGILRTGVVVGGVFLVGGVEEPALPFGVKQGTGLGEDFDGFDFDIGLAKLGHGAAVFEHKNVAVDDPD